MLTLTDRAAETIRALITQPDYPADTGLRMSLQGGEEGKLALSLEGPQPDDAVIEDSERAFSSGRRPSASSRTANSTPRLTSRASRPSCSASAASSRAHVATSGPSSSAATGTSPAAPLSTRSPSGGR